MRTLKSIPLLALAVVIGLAAFAGTGYAADAATPSDSQTLLELLRPVYDAFAGGHYAYAGALLVIVLVALVKRYAGDSVPFVHTDAGGSLLALVGGVATGLAAGLAAPGATVTPGLLESSALVGVGAAGGYAVLKNTLIDPLLKPLAARAPAWLRPALRVVLFVFDRPSDAKPEVK